MPRRRIGVAKRAQVVVTTAIELEHLRVAYGLLPHASGDPAPHIRNRGIAFSWRNVCVEAEHAAGTDGAARGAFVRRRASSPSYS